MTTGGPWWVYVVDNDSKRFAIETAPVSNLDPWHAKVSAAGSDRGRDLTPGSIAVSECPALADALALVRVVAPGYAQFEPRVIFAYHQDSRSSSATEQT